MEYRQFGGGGGAAIPARKDEMTVRDHFAAVAMQGLLVCLGEWRMRGDDPIIAERAYHLADAMLAERARATK